MDGHEYLIKYRGWEDDWQDVHTLIGEQIVFASLDEADAILQHLISMEGVVEGVILDETGTLVQHYETGPHHIKLN